VNRDREACTNPLGTRDWKTNKRVKHVIFDSDHMSDRVFSEKDDNERNGPLSRCARQHLLSLDHIVTATATPESPSPLHIVA
jgi:hypothetical protein